MDLMSLGSLKEASHHVTESWESPLSIAPHIDKLRPTTPVSQFTNAQDYIGRHHVICFYIHQDGALAVSIATSKHRPGFLCPDLKSNIARIRM